MSCLPMPSCQNHNLRNGGRYAFDQIVGDRTWYGTMDLIDVSKFVHSHSNDIMAKYEAARNDHAAIKYYNVKWSWIFFGMLQDGDVQRTLARFCIPPRTSDLDELDLHADVVKSMLEK